MEQNTTVHNKKNLISLQIFRGAAALYVMFYHLDGRYRADTAGEVVQPVFEQRFAGGLFYSGHLGVDFFFVLSGFIIFWMHQRDLGNPESSRYYLLKRIARIYPVLLVAVALKFVLAWVAGTLWTKGDLQMTALLSTIFLLPVKPTFVAGAWTLVHEILFYLLFMFGILLGRKTFWVGMAVWLAAIIGLDLAGCYQTFDGALNLFFNPHNLQFCIGVFVAYVTRKMSDSLLWPMISILLAVVLCLPGFRYFSSQWDYSVLSVKTSIWGVIFGLLIFGFVTLDRAGKTRWPSLLMIVGDASYSIYLFHLIFLAVFKKILAKSDILMSSPQLMMGVNALLTLACCLFVWRFFEKPVLLWCNTKIKRPLVTT